MKQNIQKAAGEAPAAALTDQAMTKIRDLILTGKFQAGSKLPREQDLASGSGSRPGCAEPSAADLIHLAEGERWLEMMLASGQLSRVNPVHELRGWAY